MKLFSRNILPFPTLQEQEYIRFQRAPSGNFADLLAGRPCDPRAFRRLYPDRWRDFLHHHFSSPLHVACFFEVDERTARHWWEGATAPQAWAMAFAIRAVPGAESFLAEAA